MFYFEAHKRWALDKATAELFGKQDFYLFPFVKLHLNNKLFLVELEIELDIDTEYEDKKIEHNTYFFGSIHEAIKLTELESVRNSHILLMSRRCDNDDNMYSISKLEKVFRAIDVTGQYGYIFCCENKKRYVESLITDNESELKDPEVIYYSKN